MITNLNFIVKKQEGENAINYIGSPRQYRADCQAGQFKIGSAKMVGKKITMEVIAARMFEAEMFGYAFQPWVNVIFADEKGTVSGILFKTESLENFLEIYREAYEEGTPLTSARIEASMMPRSNDKGKYFAVEFALAGDGIFSESIENFIDAMPKNIYQLAAPSDNVALPE